MVFIFLRNSCAMGNESMARMFNESLVTVSDAAEMLKVSPARVRALLASGELSGFKRSGIWFISNREIWQRMSTRHSSGRLFDPTNAWALLSLASEAKGELSGIVTDVSGWKRRFLRSRLHREGFARLAPRLVHRAKYRRYWVPAVELKRLAAEESLVLSGVSVSEKIGAELIIGDEIECYVSSERLTDLVHEYSLVDFAARPNVTFHVVNSWPFVKGLREVPLSVAVLDLIESEDERTRRAGQELIERLGI